VGDGYERLIDKLLPNPQMTLLTHRVDQQEMWENVKKIKISHWANSQTWLTTLTITDASAETDKSVIFFMATRHISVQKSNWAF